MSDAEGAVIVDEHPAASPPPTLRSVPPSWIVAALAAAALAGVVLGLASCLLLRPPCPTERQDVPASPNNAPAVSSNVDSSAVTPMLSVVSAGAAAGMGGMDRLRGGGRAAARELAATRERQVRLHAVRTDLSLNLPPSIALPDGEEHRTSFSSAAASRLQLRDAEQESEIYQKCIRPPPNRTVMDSDSPPPYRSSSAGVLASCSSSSGASSDWSSPSGNAPLVVRCHSMSSTSSTMTSKLGNHGGSHHHHHNASSQGGQKTDFLQRTVKIFTGKKTPTSTSSSHNMTPAPCVIVPQNRHQPRRDNATGPGHRPPV